MQIWSLGDVPQTVFFYKFNREIICFDINDNMLALGGEFFKIWAYEESVSETGVVKFLWDKQVVDLGKHNLKIITAVLIVNSTKILILTVDGVLMEHLVGKETIKRYVHLRVNNNLINSLINNFITIIVR